MATSLPRDRGLTPHVMCWTPCPVASPKPRPTNLSSSPNYKFRRSRPNLPAKENIARQDELKANLKRRGLICIDGIGKHPSNNWSGEASVLVLNLDLEAAKSLARHYEQHAFVGLSVVAYQR
jgi:hypothetical protein